MSGKSGWVSVRAVEVTIEPGDGFDMARTVSAALDALGWGPGEQEFNLTTNVAGPTDPPPATVPSCPGVAKAGKSDGDE